MSTSLVLFFEYALKSAEDKLTKALGQSCRLVMRRGLDEELIRVIQRIESRAFRPDLRYDIEELVSRSHEKDFLLLLVLCADNPIAFLHGHNDPADESAFFLDTVATVLEGHGVGSILVALTLLYSFEAGHKVVTLRTEEEDEKGRKLRRFYQNLGFEVFPCDPSEGVAMRRGLDLESIRAVFEKVLG